MRAVLCPPSRRFRLRKPTRTRLRRLLWYVENQSIRPCLVMSKRSRSETVAPAFPRPHRTVSPSHRLTFSLSHRHVRGDVYVLHAESEDLGRCAKRGEQDAGPGATDSFRHPKSGEYQIHAQSGRLHAQPHHPGASPPSCVWCDHTGSRAGRPD